MRVTMVVSGNLSEVRAEEVAAAYVEAHVAGAERFWYEVMDRLPSGVSTDLADQLEAHRRDAGETARYLVVWVDE